MKIQLPLWIIGGALAGLLYSAWLRHHNDGSMNRSDISANSSQVSELQVLSSRPQNAFVYNDGQTPQRELAPTDPRYDPVAHMRQDDLTSQEIFDAEPRDTTFAPIFERRIRTSYADAFRELNIESKVLSLDVECHTLSCFATVQVAKDDRKYVYDRISGLVLGDVLTPSLEDSDSGNAKTKLYMLFKPSLREEGNFQQAVNTFSHLVGVSRDRYAKTATDAHAETR